MTTSILNANPSLVGFGRDTIIYNGQGIDTIELMAKYTTVNNPKPLKKQRLGLLQALGLSPVKKLKGLPVTDTVKRIKRDAKKDGLNAIVEVFKHSKGHSLASYLIVSRLTSKSVSYDRTHKKLKGTHCLLTFAGLHQPTKRLHSESMKMIKKFLDRKTFYMSKLDIATDVTDSKPINHKRKESFKKVLKPHSNHGVIAPPNGASSLYINKVEGLERIGRILFYDKYKKQKDYHSQTLLKSLKDWKRVEVTVCFDLSKKENRMSFKAYVNSNKFLNDMLDINNMVHLINNKGYNDDYLMYQISSFIDSRTMNNNESKKQFNSLESLKRFKTSDYIRYRLPI
ncbi:MAG: Unknown protein [uncultured Sulfurovum sp.]|uniref:Uncharacterized protein n=1 Tax=uncultured Sulfurovum sp. TaxID=269237 RepID=A0A6S6SHW0_9BACT|nr:MAG: Unknown protein [uncultured Sulfurovum sp.]